MPICKYCHARISKFDKDICPVCGAKDPLSGVTSDTVEITREIDINDPQFKKDLPRTKKKAFLLFALAGWTGAAFKYLRFKPKVWVTYMIINVVILAGASTLLSLFTPLGLLSLAIVIPAVYLVNVCFGLYYLLKQNNKDAEGELIL